MSNTDSFIDEVSDEVRRDKLFHILRRYGWIAVLAVVLLVGAAALFEYRRAAQRAEAQAFGDAIVAALELETPDARRAALLDIDVTGPRRALTAMLAADTLGWGDTKNLLADDLQAIAADTDIPRLYRDMATLKYVMLRSADLEAEAALDLLEPLTAPGGAFRLLAMEQQALARLAAGDTDAAMAEMRRILEDGQVTSGLRRRAQQLIVALGGTLDAT